MEEIEKEIEEASDWETKINEVIAKIDEFKRGSYGPSPASSRRSSIQAFSQSEERSQHENILSLPAQNLNRRSEESNVGAGVKLPKINLPRFNGDVTRFSSFWQSFECAVHNNGSIPTINKLNYLFSLLEGLAYRAVEGLNLQEENYNHAVDISRFGKRQAIINAHMQSLLKLQDCPNENVEQLRKFMTP
ncbi:uncharacterized protein LOC135693624 [Rhopilema esculentum]|uniref:uncharacterized protein LOC135693624 n=1 Tax=Rhopilema esculentum TaxID=499914 RepID=UPI0031D9E779